MTTKTENLNVLAQPPIVVILGHVDHGKSTLLDYIRKTNTVEREKGGITQHIGAYEITHGGKRITFIDTPGHAAFSKMRSRGAQVADIAILVVAADDGVKTQTLEALEAIKKAGIPYLVAINKIDKPNADLNRAKQSLAEAGIYLEGYGGSIPAVPISAKTGEGVPELLDLILLSGEIAGLTAEGGPTEGIIIEAHKDKQSSVLATLIIKRGSLNRGDFLVVEDIFGSTRTIRNSKKEDVTSADVSSPVQVSGFSGVPKVGAKFLVVGSKKEAEEKVREFILNFGKKTQTEKTSDENQVLIPLVLKADTVGTLEALEHELKKTEIDKVKLKIVGRGVGTITENDVRIIVGSDEPLIVGFNIALDRAAKDLAENHRIPIQIFDIIYKASEFLEEEIKRRAPEDTTPVPIGKIKILKTFGQTKKKQVVGGEVKEGLIRRGARVAILRREAEIGEGRVSGLQAQKVSADQVGAGSQCGIEVETKTEIAPGDILLVFARKN